jgi:hypothetical protein
LPGAIGRASIGHARPHPERSDTWHVYYSVVQVGTIAVQSGLPIHAKQWRWDVGFYPVSHRGKSRSGYTSSFDQAPADFEAAWKDYRPRCREADFIEYRCQRSSTAWKYALHDAGCRCQRNRPVDGRAVSVASRSI